MTNKKLIIISLVLAVFILLPGCANFTNAQEREEIKSCINNLGTERFQPVVIRQLRSYEQKAIPFLLERIGDENELIRTGVHDVLKYQSKYIQRELIGLIDSDNPRARRDALSLLRPLTGPKTHTIPNVEELLADPDAAVRFEAAFALAEVNHQTKDTITVLLEAARNPDKDTSFNAVKGLTQLGTFPPEAAPAFIRMLQYPGEAHSLGAAALDIIGPSTLFSLSIALTSDDTEIQNDARSTLDELGISDIKPAQILGAMLYADNWEVRRDAAYHLALIHDKSAYPTSALIEILFDEYPEVRYNAVLAIKESGPLAALALPALRHVSKNDEVESIRAMALQAIEAIGAPGPDAVPVLIDVLNDLPDGNQAAALAVLAEIGPGAEAAVPVIVKFLNDMTATALRRDAINTLGAIGPGASYALPALSLLLLDVDYSTVWAVSNALQAIGGDPIPHIRNAVKDTGGELLYYCLWSMSEIGYHGAEGSNFFFEEMGNSDFGLRMGADAVYRDRYPDMSYAISVLKELVKDNYPAVRQYAVLSLAIISPDPGQVLPFIEPLLLDKDPFVRATAAGAIGYIGPAASGNIPRLLKMIEDDNEITRVRAMWAIGMMKGEAQDLLPMLEKMYEAAVPGRMKQELDKAIRRITSGKTSTRHIYGR